MIYFIDEDESQLEAFRIEIEIRGHDVKFLRDADSAYDVLSKEDPAAVDLVIVDIMLSTRGRNETRFSRNETADFLKTGLVLIESLIKAKPELRQRIVIFTGASTTDILDGVKAISVLYELPVFRKRDYTSPKHFFDNIVRPVVSRKQVTDASQQEGV